MMNDEEHEKRSEFDQVLDLFLLRIHEPKNVEHKPYYTTGSIVSAALLRGIILLVVLWFVHDYFANPAWFYSLMVVTLWGLCAYPAYMQYIRFNEKIEIIRSETLCGNCRYFNPTSQLCIILDEHVTTSEPPCGGEEWEPR